MNKPIITVDQLDFAYEQKPILQNVNLQLNAGEFVGLIGPNGAGKSTLLRLLMGLSKADQGEIKIFDKPLKNISRKNLAQMLTLVPQDSQINYAFTVKEIISMGRNPWLNRFEPASKKDLEIIEQAMEKTDVLHYKDKVVNQLSGGERQRVLIARAIAQQTDIILLDEATANLDICHQLEILELAKALSSEGRLVIAAIHDLSMASRFCERLVLLAKQNIQADALPEQVITEQNLYEFFDLQAVVEKTSNTQLSGSSVDYGLHITPIHSVKSKLSQNS